MTKENPFTKKAGKYKLKPFGASTNGSSVKATSKPNPFSVVAKKIDITEYELSQINEQIKEASKIYEQELNEANRLFKPVDKLSLRGQTHTTKYSEAKSNWDIAWRKVERTYSQLQTLSARLRKLRGRSNGSRAF